MQHKTLLYYILFNLLIAQLGLNIFSAYCCCVKEITTSIFPSSDSCAKLPGVSCCKKNKCSLPEKGTPKPCGKKETKYTSSGFIGEQNHSSFELNPIESVHVPSIPWNLFLLNFSPSAAEDLPVYVSEIPLHLQYCSWRC